MGVLLNIHHCARSPKIAILVDEATMCGLSHHARLPRIDHIAVRVELDDRRRGRRRFLSWVQVAPGHDEHVVACIDANAPTDPSTHHPATAWPRRIVLELRHPNIGLRRRRVMGTEMTTPTAARATAAIIIEPENSRALMSPLPAVSYCGGFPVKQAGGR